ncbi:MAG: tRNA (adenosine(37)-N6)-threonylcarbamoyltransferase complex ATPase subunit type 1 TsaE [Firmicutes bacterium]|nr:tRNA (adenosine(37)-N6)-threonylcarbamoyltransferase complex ATPase subunit type 1 TsaE [Bacillota bacterium]
MIKEVFSAEETEKIGFDIGKNAKKGDIYFLSGDLGVGKTVFTKGFAKGIGIEEHVTSPTFTIVNEYENGGNKFYHFDVYRINDIEEMYDIGYDEYFYGEGICLIEWAEMIEELIPENALWIEIKKDIEKGLDYRIIEVKNEDPCT